MGMKTRDEVVASAGGEAFIPGLKRDPQIVQRQGRRHSMTARVAHPTDQIPNVMTVTPRWKRWAALLLVKTRSHRQRAQNRVSKTRFWRRDRTSSGGIPAPTTSKWKTLRVSVYPWV